MNSLSQPLFIGEQAQKPADRSVEGGYVTLLGEPYYQIRNFDAMEPFFISLVSSSDHWLFISSTGGISAGRSSAEQAIFPYYTVDKITENSENTGSKALLIVERAGRRSLWEPFSERQRGVYRVERNLYKNATGTALVFEETNLDLALRYRYAWRTGDRFGFIKTTWLTNTGDSECRVEALDGIQNILPANITSQTQNTFSVLLDAYKRSELHAETGLGIFSLSSRLTDLAEPSESLLATSAAQVGLEAPAYLLSSLQLDRFRAGEGIEGESDVRGRRGAYFAYATLALAAGEERAWHLLVDTRQEAGDVTGKLGWLRGATPDLMRDVEADIAAGQARLREIVAAADGIQLSNQRLLAEHHFANVLFNVMRGGIFADQYWMRAKDLVDFVRLRNRTLLEAQAEFFAGLPEKIHLTELLERAEASGSEELVRMSYAYLPLTFSRRHGDPSRPWNRFEINIKQPDGSQKLDYEGNWRDIFQNWEALAYSYPEYTESMISTFLNATTADGYNPYRITQSGIDWEAPEPGNPWANIGYWSDHQIIYLLKLMEISRDAHPGKLEGFLDRPLFSTANIPYRIKPYAELLKDPYSTIDFDWELEQQVEARVKEIGSDGKLIFNADGSVYRVTLAEKLLILLLAKLANFVPEGGIWMNTQRPEWNDANNALVGKGISVVTLCYLRRYVAFCQALFAQGGAEAYRVSGEVQRLFERVHEILQQPPPQGGEAYSDAQRRAFMDALGEAGSEYRWNLYKNGLSGERGALSAEAIGGLLEAAQRHVEHSLRANRRSDDLYHSYNILHLSEGAASVSHMYEMLEGQAAILSSGMLDAQESLALLNSLRNSALYQPETNTYILYPDRDLPGFLVKNRLTREQVMGVPLLAALSEAEERSIISVDSEGAYHFAGQVRNIKDVDQALERLERDPRYADLVQGSRAGIRELFEATFHHNQFTGRSSTFFAYEGLGSVYWHMVAKLLLAVQESAVQFRDTAEAPALLERYVDIRQGLGFNKTPAEFGAFPTDPYSHTPKGQGAKQPGMTGLVKEEILTRQGDLGYRVRNGQMVFDPMLFDTGELLTEATTFAYRDVRGQAQEIALEPGAMVYTICQTPVVLRQGETPRIRVHFADGTQEDIEGNVLDSANSQHIFARDGQVHHLSLACPTRR